jgi:acyl carrier protein
MTNEHLQTRVKEVLADVFQLPAEDLPDDLIFGDIPQWDSMGHMEVMMSLEQHFGIEVTADTIGGLTSLQAICSYLEVNGHAHDHA